MSTNAINHYDFTLKADACSVDELKTFLRGWAKKWIFQTERGDTGYEHYQGRLSLIKKRRFNEFITAVRQKCEYPFHWSASSTNSLSNDSFYCTKEDTRIDGPWRDDDEEIYVPRQVREIEKLKPWQQSIVDSANNWDTRHIDVLVDETGNNGKTILSTYLEVNGYGAEIPYFNDYEVIMQMVMGMKPQRLYVIDCPRAVDRDMTTFWRGIEKLKNGYAFDRRYSFKRRRFDCPNIWIFSNEKFDTSMLSYDRWRFWRIEMNELVRMY